MNTSLTIGELGKRSGLSPKTIRFYEETGVIKPAKRAANGYRIYEQEAIEELKVIKYARGLGLPIEEIKRLMKGCENGKCEHSADYIGKEITSYLELLDARINQLMLLKNRLNKMKTKLPSQKTDCTDKTKYYCNILEQIAH